jgi:glucose-6-phosphate dehydrogenase assembly protein OpcA
VSDSEALWSEQDTNPDAIEDALRELLRERHAENEALAPARVLNLVVIVDNKWRDDVADRLQRVGRYHASRTVLCAVEKGRKKLDAKVVMAFGEPTDSGLALIHEEVVIDLGPDHLSGIETIVDPVIVPGLATMVWSPHGHEEAVDALKDLTDVVLLDSDEASGVVDAFDRARTLLRSAYVVDLAWLRTTPWRERLAASFDPSWRRAELSEITGVSVRHRAGASASARLLVGWLASRLGWEVGHLDDGKGGGIDGKARKDEDGHGVELHIEPVDQEVPGLAGVTLTAGETFWLSLDRGPGGLRAQVHRPNGTEGEWRVLGASRGEAGILGEGVRQALLRDPTYGPALNAARRLC